MSILNVLPFFEPEIDAMVQGQILSFFFFLPTPGRAC